MRDSCLDDCAKRVNFEANGDHVKNRAQAAIVRQKIKASGGNGRARNFVPALGCADARKALRSGNHQAMFHEVLKRPVNRVLVKSGEVARNVVDALGVRSGEQIKNIFMKVSVQFHFIFLALLAADQVERKEGA
jgi:hypothetical protein